MRRPETETAMSTEAPAWLSGKIRINKDSSVPLYQQLKDSLLEAVTEETLHPGDRLPSERELQDHFSVSRLTVRRALTDLITAGWLFTQPGKGTYIRSPKVEQGIQQLGGLTQDMRARGYTVTSRVLRVSVMPATGKTAKALGLAPGQDVVLLERLRFVGGEPLSIERSYLNHKLCPGIAACDLSGSLYGLLQQRYGLRMLRAEQDYEAVAAGRREAQLLNIPEGAPLLLCERMAYADSGETAEYGVAWYRGDRYRFHAVLLGTDAGPAVAVGQFSGPALAGR
jgi:GntR family transcriptional regulator